MKKPIFSIGVDLGGTNLRARAVNKSGRVVRRADWPAVPPEKLHERLKILWGIWEVQNVHRLVVGSKGVWTSSERKLMKNRLGPLAEDVRVMSDVELAFLSTFPGDESGILLIAGTGSIALGRDSDGKWIRAGGLGPKKGDEGSGFWMGREYLRRRKKIPAGSLSVREIASYSRYALRDEIAEEARKHLAGLIFKSAEKLDLEGEWRIGLAGGLFESAHFKKQFILHVRRSRPERKILFFSPKSGGAETAARMGCVENPKREIPHFLRRR